MNARNEILKKEEQVLFALRALYRQYGYSCFKMSKFEEYDLYVQNKDFLVSDSVITFTDTNGRLMALKPDVTLSIVKNTKDRVGTVQRFYYDENVYRVSEKTRAYKEIMQAGLECIGDVSMLEVCEVIALAGRSLHMISDDCVLTLSHLGVVSALLDRPELSGVRRELLSCIGERNSHGIARLCAQCGAPEELERRLQGLIAAYGPAEQVISALREQEKDENAVKALDELAFVTGLLEKTWGVQVCLDFSLVSDMNYYNGLMFRGFVRGIPSSVLSGGQYDNLMKRMGKTSRAIGFAVYLDQLERMGEEGGFDADVLLLYDEKDDVALVLKRAEDLRAQGKRVSVQREVPEKFHYGELIRFSDPAEGGKSHG